MPNNWINALKEYNKGKSSFCITRKGSKEYQEVIKIMDKMNKTDNMNKPTTKKTNKTDNKPTIE